MSVDKEKKSAGPLVREALLVILGSITTSGAFAVGLRSSFRDLGLRLVIQVNLRWGPSQWQTCLHCIVILRAGGQMASDSKGVFLEGPDVLATAPSAPRLH